MLIDEQDAPGGQIYRGVERAADAGSPLGADYLAGAHARRRVPRQRRASTARRPPSGTSIPTASLSLISPTAAARRSTARRILLATGAIERPVPIPGWTLPGVMTAGAAQILLKTADLVPEGRAVLAGQGPLLYLVAAQLARAGAPPAAILETDAARQLPRRRRPCSAPPGPGGARCSRGSALIRELRRAGIPIVRGVRGLRARRPRAGSSASRWDGGEIAADLLLLHEGVIPNTQISLGLAARPSLGRGAAVLASGRRRMGRTSLPTIAIAGDGGGIAGAAAAALSGRLAALDAAAALDKIDAAERDRRAAPIRAALAPRAGDPPVSRRALPPGRRRCSCPADAGDRLPLRGGRPPAQIRRAARLGAQGPNQAKAFTRCGMGPCQGRICGPIVAR